MDAPAPEEQAKAGDDGEDPHIAPNGDRFFLGWHAARQAFRPHLEVAHAHVHDGRRAAGVHEDAHGPDGPVGERQAADLLELVPRVVRGEEDQLLLHAAQTDPSPLGRRRHLDVLFLHQFLAGPLRTDLQDVNAFLGRLDHPLDVGVAAALGVERQPHAAAVALFRGRHIQQFVNEGNLAVPRQREFRIERGLAFLGRPLG